MASMANPHALLFPWPSPGHMIPFLQFSRALSASGFAISFLVTHHNRRLMAEALREEEEAHGIRFLTIPLATNSEHFGIDRVSELCHALDNAGDALEESIHKLREEGNAVTFIISDVFLLFTQDVATKLGIPRAAFWTQSAANYGSNLLFSRGYRPMATELITCIPGTPPVRFSDLNNALQSLDPSDYGFNYVVNPFKRLGEADLIIINSFQDLERDAVLAIREQHDLYAVGPLISPLSFFNNSFDRFYGLRPVDNDCLPWLDKQAPCSVIYVSFGSISIMSERDIAEFAIGLEATGHSILWVARNDLMCGKSAVFPEGFKERLGSRAMFVSWAPQQQVLCHPSIGAFLTHCGWNSTLESICAGVPMIGWPYFADQRLNMRCIADLWKIGVALEGEKDGSISREEVKCKVRRIMDEAEGKEIKRRIGVLKDAAKAAVEEGGSSCNDFQRLVTSLRSPSHRKSVELGSHEQH